MRAFVLSVTVLAACGGGGGGGGMMTIDASTIHDSPVSVDAPGSYDFLCGGTTACTLDKICCTNPGPPVSFTCSDKPSCPAPDQISCDGPDECMTGDVCCGVDVPDGSGTFPNCGTTSIGATCTAEAACTTKVVQSCNQTSRVQLCHEPADCHDPNNDQCCTFSSGAASLTFCIDALTAQVAGGVCH